MKFHAGTDLKRRTEDASRKRTTLVSEEAAHSAGSPKDAPRDWEELSCLQEEIESLRGWRVSLAVTCAHYCFCTCIVLFATLSDRVRHAHSS